MMELLAVLALFWPLFVASAAGSSEWLELRHGLGHEAHRQRLSTPPHGPPCHPITEQPALQLKPPFTSQLMRTLRWHTHTPTHTHARCLTCWWCL